MGSLKGDDPDFFLVQILIFNIATGRPAKMTKIRRSQDWYGKIGKDGFTHRSWMKTSGQKLKLAKHFRAT